MGFGREKYGAVLVAAVGNQSNNNYVVPGTHVNVPGMVSVSATNAFGDLVSFFNFGQESVHLFAPGEHIVSAGAFSLAGTTKSGISQVAHMVSAVLSKFLAKKKKISPEVLERKLFDATKTMPHLADLSVNGS